MIKKNMLKKLLTSILLAIFLLTTVSVPYVQAQTWYNQSFKEWSSKVFDEDNPQEIFGERYTFAQVQWIVYSISALLAGSDLLKCAGLATQETLEQFGACVESLNPYSGSNGQSILKDPGPTVGLAFITDSLMQIRPASGIQYFADAASKLNIIPEAHAQGLGFRSLQPIQRIWKAFRNLAYLLLIVVILIMAFMIMFRVKISPQTIITIQSALPRIVITLILITFSYAIAGLLIDFSYLIIALVAAFAKSSGLAATIEPPQGGLPMIELAQRMWGTSATPIGSLILVVLLPLIVIFVVGGAGLIIAGAAAGTTIPVPVLGTLSGVVVGTILAVLAFAIPALIIIIIIFRVIWAMVKAFINIILLIIFGPLILLIGGISPAAGGFGLWLRNLAANIAVFPTIAIMGFIAHLLYWSTPHTILDVIRRGSWVNPFEIEATASSAEIFLPLFSANTFWFSLLGALGILLLMPSVANLIKSIIQGQPFNYGTAMGQALAVPYPITAAWRSPAATAAREQYGMHTALGIFERLRGKVPLAGDLADQIGKRLGKEK